MYSEIINNSFVYMYKHALSALSHIHTLCESESHPSSGLEDGQSSGTLSPSQF